MTREKIINFDMDGTLADFYGVENWLQNLIDEDVRPYIIAQPKVNTTVINTLLTLLKTQGYEINIISWGAKNSSTKFLKATETAKKEWLKKNFDFDFDNIYVVPYGTPKDTIKRGILFDDDKNVRDAYNGVAFREDVITDMLFRLLFE